MMFSSSVASVAVAALLLCESVIAAPHAAAYPAAAPYSATPESGPGYRKTRRVRRDDPTYNATAVTTSLEPVLPPDVNEDALSVLSLGTNVTLAWAGNSGESSSYNSNPSQRRKMLKRDGAVFSQAKFQFHYPTVPLDHSNFVSGVSCTNGSLTGTLTSNAYGFAKRQWMNASDIVFVTSVDGCGLDDVNDYFHATSMRFSDSDYTFVARGASANYTNVARHMNLQWGNVGSLNVKRAVDKRQMFEPHPLHERAYLDFSFDWGLYLSDIIGVDNEAPWPYAALLAKWGKEYGEEDDSHSKGEVASTSSGGHHKRSNITDLAIRDELMDTSLAPRSDDNGVSIGLKLWCVECGFSGSADLFGEIDADFSILPPFFSLNTVQAGFTAELKVGINLGMQAYIKYSQTATEELDRVNLGGFDIPLLCDVGPFISLSVSAEAGVEATGNLLIGTAVEWNDIDVLLDFLHPSNSHAKGFIPHFVANANASGELKIEGKLGLPVKLGLGVELIEGLWDADAAIVDTPALVMEGKFEVSAEVDTDGNIEHSINDGCYGIAWDIHFENTLAAVIEADDIGKLTYNLIDPQESEPIAQGCIGYVQDGTDDDDSDDPEGTGSSTGTTGNGLRIGGFGLSGGSGSRPKSSSKSSSKKTTSTAKAPTNIKAGTVATDVSAVGQNAATDATSSSTTAAPTTSSPVSSTSISGVSSASSSKTSTSSKGPSSNSSPTSSTKASTTTSFKVSSASTSSQQTITISTTKAASFSSVSKSTSISKSTTSVKPTTTVRSSTTTKAASTTSTKKSTTTTKAASSCTPSQVITNPTPAATATCKSVIDKANVATSLDLGAATTVKSADLCAAACLKNTACMSFSFSTANSCQLYKKIVKNLGVTAKAGNAKATFWDRGCYSYSSCPK